MPSEAYPEVRGGTWDTKEVRREHFAVGLCANRKRILSSSLYVEKDCNSVIKSAMHKSCLVLKIISAKLLLTKIVRWEWGENHVHAGALRVFTSEMVLRTRRIRKHCLKGSVGRALRAPLTPYGQLEFQWVVWALTSLCPAPRAAATWDQIVRGVKETNKK